MLSGQAVDRTSFLHALDVELARDPGQVAVVRVDLDRFSRIRETFGASVAKAVRAILVTRLEGVVTGPDHAMQYGEDAFVLVIKVEDSLPETLETAAMDIIELVSAPMEGPDGVPIAVGSNVGIAAGAHFEAGDPLRLMTGAELAVQRANTLGARRAIVYEVAQRDDPTRLPHLFADMLTAVNARQFSPDFQPIVSLPDRRIAGAEALVRWHHPEHGILMPHDFIPEAENSGLVRQIDSDIRQMVCRMWASHPIAENLSVSVNLSAADLDATDLPDHVASCLDETGMPPSRLVLEVTETALSQDWPRAKRRLTALKALGVRLAVDDFGSGHMFLDRLSTGLFDILKIDRNLVIAEEGDVDRALELLTAVTSMAHTLGMSVVAEGIETEEHLQRVLDAGCDRGQGFLFSEPWPPEALAQRVAESRVF